MCVIRVLEVLLEILTHLLSPALSYNEEVSYSSKLHPNNEADLLQVTWRELIPSSDFPPLATQPWRRFSQNRYILHYFRLSLVLFSEVWSILTASVYWRRNYFFPSLRFADPCVATIYSNQSSGAVVWMKTSEALITKELISLLFVVLKEFADRFGILHSWSALLFFFTYYYYWN